MKPMLRITQCLLKTDIPGLHPKSTISDISGEGSGIIFLHHCPMWCFHQENFEWWTTVSLESFRNRYLGFCPYWLDQKLPSNVCFNKSLWQFWCRQFLMSTTLWQVVLSQTQFLAGKLLKEMNGRSPACPFWWGAPILCVVIRRAVIVTVVSETLSVWFNPYNKPMKCNVLYSWGNWGIERQSNLPTTGRARIKFWFDYKVMFWNIILHWAPIADT